MRKRRPLPDPVSTASAPWTARAVFAALFDFVVKQATSCLFAALILVGLAVTAIVDLPWPRYDALLVYALAVTLVLWLTKWETNRELGVIFGFHLLGLGAEIWGVSVGAWSYTDEGNARIFDVPLFSGFMYASIGSYICQAWRRLDMRVTEYRPVLMTTVAVLMYVNFFTDDIGPDMRIPLSFAALVVLGRTRIHFTVAGRRIRMPLAIGIALTGMVVWLAENVGTYFGAWTWAYQRDGWEMVHVGTMGSWAILVSLSFALIATVKLFEGRLYGHPGDRASVEASHHRYARREESHATGNSGLPQMGDAKTALAR